MSSPEPNDLPIVEPATARLGEPCRHLRNKGMYVFTDGCDVDTHGDYDNTIYWCLKTMKGYGPDDDMVGGDDCRNASRSCYEPS